MVAGRDKVTIKIPRELYQRLKAVVAGSGFGSVTEFIVYVMRDLVAAEHVEHHATLDDREVEMIRKRLKALGYLD
jgi:metal-responsive CopG/Arc/MetJ family transcriptional regulator